MFPAPETTNPLQQIAFRNPFQGAAIKNPREKDPFASRSAKRISQKLDIFTLYVSGVSLKR